MVNDYGLNSQTTLRVHTFSFWLINRRKSASRDFDGGRTYVAVELG